MATRSIGGLSGKARRVHHRGHADRRFAERLIAEYLEPGERPRRRAHDAPIARSRREFMATVPAEMEMADSGKESQLELAWDRRKESDDGRMANRRVVWSTSDETTDDEQAVALIKVPTPKEALVGHKNNDKPDSVTCADTAPAPNKTLGIQETVTSTEPRVLRVPRRSEARMPIGWSQAPAANPELRLSLRGFVRGCAIGGVAAAVVLTVLRVTLG